MKRILSWGIAAVLVVACAPRTETASGHSEPDLGWLFLEKGPYTLSTHVDAAPGEASFVLVKDVSLMAATPDTVLCKVADLESEIAQDRAAMETAKAEITAALSELEDYREQQALYGRYVECNAWAAIAKDCGFHIRTVQRQHDAGIEHLAVLMEGRMPYGQE